MKEILYFPPKAFSPRFGDQFFTVTIEGYEILGHPSACGGQYAEYNLQVSRGKKAWNVRKRFSEFDLLNISLAQNFPNNLKLPSLPPKTCFRTVEKTFLANRQNQLQDYLNSLLSLLSTEKLLVCENDSPVLAFLNIEEIV